MKKSQSQTKRVLFALFLAAFYLCSAQDAANAYVAIDPYSVQDVIIRNPLFDSYALGELQNKSIVPFVTNGSVEFYISGDDICVQKENGLCVAVACGNIICGSNKLNASAIAGAGNETVIDYGLVSGNAEIHNATDEINALRYAALDQPEYLSMIENGMMQNLGSSFEQQYVQERYGNSINNLISQEITSDPALSGLNGMLSNNDVSGAVNLLDSYFSQNYNISPVFDSNNLYDAVKNRQIGPVQYSEILKTIMNQQGIDESLSNLMNQSSILNSTLGKEALDAAAEVLKNNPELLKELEKSINTDNEKLFEELLSQVMKEAFRNPELLKKYLEALPDLLKDKNVRDLLFKSSSEALRQMHASGELDKALDEINSPEVRDEIANQIKESAPSAFEQMLDWLKNQVEWKYVFPVIGLLIILFVSIRSGL